MIDEQNFPTVVATDLQPGDQIWHHDEIHTVGEVTEYAAMAGHVYVSFPGWGICYFAKDKRFPRYVPKVEASL
jgi:hypothetical protein